MFLTHLDTLNQTKQKFNLKIHVTPLAKHSYIQERSNGLKTNKLIK